MKQVTIGFSFHYSVNYGAYDVSHKLIVFLSPLCYCNLPTQSSSGYSLSWKGLVFYYRFYFFLLNEGFFLKHFDFISLKTLNLPLLIFFHLLQIFFRSNFLYFQYLSSYFHDASFFTFFDLYFETFLKFHFFIVFLLTMK